MTREITIQSEEQVRRINRLAANAPYEVWLSTSTLMLDARSLLGLFALIGKKAKVVVDDGVSPRSFQHMVAKMS